MTTNILKIAEEVFKVLDDLVDDPIETQAVLQILGTLAQAKFTQQQMQKQGGGILG